MNQYNESESQLFWFLQFRHEANEKISMTLRPQGDSTTIAESATNLCEVEIGDNVYLFGGIREDVYDNFVEVFVHKKIYEGINECDHSFVDQDNEAPYGHSVCRYCGETESK